MTTPDQPPLDCELATTLEAIPRRPSAYDSRQLGASAQGVLGELLTTPAPTARRYWLNEDVDAFEHLSRFEEHISTTQIGAEVPATRRASVAADLTGLIGRYHEALPYSNIEWSWLRTTYATLEKADESVLAQERTRLDRQISDSWAVTHKIHVCHRSLQRQRPRTIAQLTATGTVDDQPWQISGRDLHRRWWAWRRHEDDFEDGHQLHAARLALANMAELLLPPEREAQAANATYPGTFLYPETVADIQRARDLAASAPDRR